MSIWNLQPACCPLFLGKFLTAQQKKVVFTKGLLALTKVNLCCTDSTAWGVGILVITTCFPEWIENTAEYTHYCILQVLASM